MVAESHTGHTEIRHRYKQIGLHTDDDDNTNVVLALGMGSAHTISSTLD